MLAIAEVHWFSIPLGPFEEYVKYVFEVSSWGKPKPEALIH